MTLQLADEQRHVHKSVLMALVLLGRFVCLYSYTSSHHFCGAQLVTGSWHKLDETLEKLAVPQIWQLQAARAARAAVALKAVGYANN